MTREAVVAHLLEIACVACQQNALEADEADAIAEALGDALLAAPDLLETALNEARYRVEHWPFCQECYDDFSAHG
jgi:hypothetical protein